MFFNALTLALRAIRRNVMRSFLTVLGIVIGVAAVIAMVILGDGTTAYITKTISKLGSNMLIMTPGQERTHHQIGAAVTFFDAKDLEAIKREVPNLRAVTPITTQGRVAIYGNESYATTVNGTDNDYFTVRDWGFSQGGMFTEADLKAGKSVCIIGETVKTELFGSGHAVGERIRLTNIACDVIGVLEDRGASTLGMDQDDLILVPLKMFQRRISGNHDIATFLISVRDNVSTESVRKEIEALMRERRHIKKGEEDDFFVQDMKDIIQTLSQTTGILTILLGTVAAISLLVGGIGIMNIMLVSVTERTREIGIRLAIGALQRDVLLQFLVEAAVLATMGGIIGIALGLGAAYAGVTLLEIPFVFNTSIIAIAFAFSTGVGLIFGFFPARKAANLDPIEALRHE